MRRFFIKRLVSLNSNSNTNTHRRISCWVLAQKILGALHLLTPRVRIISQDEEVKELSRELESARAKNGSLFRRVEVLQQETVRMTTEHKASLEVITGVQWTALHVCFRNRNICTQIHMQTRTHLRILMHVCNYATQTQQLMHKAETD